ncbi:MAG TPA: low affinity iron permease family protein [Actinomycetota bacterium]|nr:low affinity iron permease family protein [Actinomycetota bacterium]
MSERRSGGQAHTFFSDFSTFVAKWTGSHWALLIAAALVVVSLSLVGVEITNIAISIVTLLMVFVLQNTQNRDSAALHLKLDEMVRVQPEARDDVRGVESKTEEEIKELHVEHPGDASDVDRVGSRS